MSKPPVGQWYRCKGCGQPCGIVDLPGYPSPCLVHAKPHHLAGVPNSVPCELYRRCESLAFFMKHLAGESLDPPTDMTPFTN